MPPAPEHTATLVLTDSNAVGLEQSVAPTNIPTVPDERKHRLDKLHVLTEAEFKILVSRIDIPFPCLKDDLTGLSDHILYLLDHDKLPPEKLHIEMLSRDEFNLLRSRGWSLKELFEPAMNRANN
jgi:hypothetical protein